MPIALAIDFGGVLWWSQYIAALATALVVVLTAMGWVASGCPGQSNKQILLVPLLLWVGLAWFQTVSLPQSSVAWLSPASVTAYTDWVEPYVEVDQAPNWIPISLSMTDSRHSVALLCLIVGIAWSSAIVFDSRMRLGMMLSFLAVGAASIAAIGLWLRVFPNQGFFGFEEHLSSSSFSTFVNRNNAALLLNLGLAASLGLLSWRLTALTGQEVDDPDFDFSDLFSLINDRDSMIGIISATLCVSGLLVGGSRGGVVAALIGILIAFGWVRRRRGLASLPVIASVVGICTAILLVPTNLSLESIQRLEVFTSSSQSTLLNDGRLTHWPDGLRAAAAHFPLGSGLATYGDAVHPHQRTSSSSGFAHADNLWIELVTEQGIVGFLLTATILIVLIRSLHRMGESADPIDLGLRIAGWFALAAIITSQVFDFGLIVPANLFAVATLLPAIVARNISAGTASKNTAIETTPAESQHDDSQPQSMRFFATRTQLFATRSQRSLMIACATIACALLIPSLSILQSDAQSDAVLRELESELKWIRTDDLGLATWIKRLTDDAQENPLPSTFEALCELYFLRARLADVAEQNPKSPAEAVALYQQTSPFLRRLKPDDSRENPNRVVPPFENASDGSNALYRQSLAYSSDAIRLRPLAQTPRPYQVYLDFLHQDRKRTQVGLEHLAVVYAQEPSTLVKIGSLAADSGNLSLASALWRSAITTQPALTSQALADATRHGVKSLNSLMPSTSANYRLAATYVLSNPQLLQPTDPTNSKSNSQPDSEQPDPNTPSSDPTHALQLLRECLHGLDCENCDSQSERANCEQLAGDAAYALQEFEDCFTHYQQALRYDPMNASLRFKLILRLKDQNQRRLALEEARKARMMIKDDPRFTQVIEAMAAEDLSPR